MHRPTVSRVTEVLICSKRLYEMAQNASQISEYKFGMYFKRKKICRLACFYPCQWYDFDDFQR